MKTFWHDPSPSSSNRCRSSSVATKWLSLKNIQRKKKRTCLVCVCISVMAFCICVVFSFNASTCVCKVRLLPGWVEDLCILYDIKNKIKWQNQRWNMDFAARSILLFDKITCMFVCGCVFEIGPFHIQLTRDETL